MKKLAIFLVIVLALSAAAYAVWNYVPGVQDLFNKPCTEHVDANGDYICDNCNEQLQHDDPQPEQHECADGDNDHKCDDCGEALSQCADADTDHKCDVCGAEMGEHVAAEGGHDCGYCGLPASECADNDGDYLCDICGEEKLPDNLERVNYSLNIGTLETGTLASDSINGKFTIVSGSEIRNRTKPFDGIELTKSVKIGNSSTKIMVDVPGEGKLRFIVQNGSSGADMQFITVTSPDGVVYDIEFLGNSGGSPAVMIELDVTQGEWIISRGKNGGTQDVFYLDLSCIVEKADENGFELVSAGKVDYLCGQQLDLSGLRLNATFANGKTEPLSLDDLSVDTSLVNFGASGTYPITISYKEYAPISVNINVYLPVEVELHFDAIEKLSQNTSAGNGVYYNHSFKEVYSVGEELDFTGLNVIVRGTLGEAEKSFNVGKQYAIVYDTEDFTTSGEKIITVKYQFGAEEILANVSVHLVDLQPTVDPDTGSVRALVDPAYLGIIGDLSGPFHVFTTIQQALDFLAKVDANTPKVLSIAPGYYNEKLEITIPNLTIEGVGEKPEDVVIEWDSLYGLNDAGGFTHTTDSTQTVAIRESAYNVTIKNVTISNYWNSQERMDAAGLGIERGLALLVQADRFTMKDSRLLGIQDTLELFTGRQYFENVYISGYTDFIFGTNNTTYFKGCTIHVIDTEKDDKGTAGYLTAFKGSNKGANDAIVYGAIFDQCKFTADEGVMEGKTAIGRTWGAYAAVAVINSELGGHISLDGYNPSNNKNTRYISMNGVNPTDSTVQFVEYNNTGAGAITEAVAGMRFLSDEEAALYADFATIFGTINGKVSYRDPWNPESTEIIVDDRDYYYFNGGSSSTGTSHTFDTATTITKGTTLEWDGLLISAENGNVAWNSNANALNMKAGAFIKFTVAAGTTVIVETYPSYNYFTLNGVATASANMLSQYYAEATEVILLSTGDLYLYSIIINPGEEAPAAPTLTEIKVDGFNVNYTVGDELALDGVTVKAYYSDNSVRIISEYTVDHSAVVNTAAGSYDVIFGYEGKTAIATVTYEDPNADPAITDSIVLDFTTTAGLESVQNNPRVTMDGSIRHNGGEIQIQGTISFMVKAGTTVTVIPYANEQYASYTIGMEGESNLTEYHTTMGMIFDEDCTVVYTGLSNNYLCQIIVEPPVKDGKYVFGGSSEEGDVTGILESGNNISISGTCKTHSGGAQLSGDSQIIFNLPAFATMTIKGYDTSYGQLDVFVNGEKIEMNANACYVYTATNACSVMINATNVGTEESPAYNKSYITYIDIDVMDAIDENLEVTFGSAGNYHDSGIDFSGIQIGDNGGNNSQVKNGSFSFAVKAGATVTINGYPGYTSYTFSAGLFTSDEITAEKYEYTAYENTIVTITPVSGNNYFYSFSISYPAAKENVSITFGSEGNYNEGNAAVDLSGVQVVDNGGTNSQVKNGSIVITLYAGATLTIKGYNGYTDYTLSDGTTEYVINKDSADHTAHSYTAAQDVTVTITITSGSNYFYGIEIVY